MEGVFSTWKGSPGVCQGGFGNWCLFGVSLVLCEAAVVDVRQREQVSSLSILLREMAAFGGSEPSRDDPQSGGSTRTGPMVSGLQQDQLTCQRPKPGWSHTGLAGFQRVVPTKVRALRLR